MNQDLFDEPDTPASDAEKRRELREHELRQHNTRLLAVLAQLRNDAFVHMPEVVAVIDAAIYGDWKKWRDLTGREI